MNDFEAPHETPHCAWSSLDAAWSCTNDPIQRDWAALCTGGGMPWQEASKSAFAAWGGGGGVSEIATGRGALQAAGFAMGLASPPPARCTMQVWPIQIPLWLYTFEGQKWGLMYCGIGAAVRRKSPVLAFILFVLQQSLKNRRDRCMVAHTVYILCI